MDYRWLPLGAALMLAAPAFAQSAQRDDEATPHISVELNAATASDSGGCTLSFVVTNNAGADLEQVVYETVLFDADGQVDRLTLFDFGALPQTRPRVRQFTLPTRDCDGYGRILFNGAATCTGDGGPLAVCGEALRLSTRTPIEVVG